MIYIPAYYGVLVAGDGSGGGGGSPFDPTAPDNFHASGGSSFVGFTWDDNSSDEDGFQVEEFTGGVWVSYGAPTGANATSSGSSQSPGSFTFRVYAFRSGHPNRYSNSDTATVT